MFNRRKIVFCICGILLSSSLFAVEPTKVSAYAPIVDIKQQLGYFTGLIEKTISKSAITEKDQDQLRRNAYSIAILAMALSNHDGKDPLKSSAGSIFGAAQKIADAAADQEAASLEFKNLKAAMESSKESDQVEWQPVGEISDLMLQVPYVDNQLRRAVNSRRFTRSLDKTAGLSVSLAAMSQVATLDHSYCADEDDEKAWDEYCIKIRDLAAEINVAVRNKDQDLAKSKSNQLHKVCDQCHVRFRD